jgi:hypothetical protein
MTVVSNTSPLNYLVLIELQQLLPALVDRVFVPEWFKPSRTITGHRDAPANLPELQVPDSVHGSGLLA